MIRFSGGSRSNALSLRPLERFTDLQRLTIGGRVSDVEVFGQLSSLRSLTLASVTLDDLTVLSPLRRLRFFRLLLGGTGNLAGLESLPELVYLELWQVRGLRDLSVLGDLTGLEELHLQALRDVDRIPSLDSLGGLKAVWIERLRALHDLSGVALAPALEQLALIDMPQLTIDDLRPLIGHPTLRRGTIGLGSQSRNRAADGLLPLARPQPKRFLDDV